MAQERYLAPGFSRWLQTGNYTGVLLSVEPPPPGITVDEPGNLEDIARRIRIPDEDAIAALQVAGIARCEFQDWLRPLGYLRHARRRIGFPVRDDALPVENFWELLVDTLTREGHPLGTDTEIRILSAQPGSYFGRHDSPELEGRWIGTVEDGVWCAYRRGYSDAHWHPVIVAADGRELRALDLYDADEWRWAVIARGRAVGPHERVYQNGNVVQLSFQPPSQLSAAMDLLGPRTRGWTWQVAEGAPSFWSSLL